jgi:probable HAF family extracellular repeat protein
MKQVHSSHQVVRQSVVVLASLSFLLGTVPDTYSQVAPSPTRLPNFDARTNSQPQKAALNATQQQGAAQLKNRNSAVAVDVDPITGAPAWIHAQGGFLTRSTAQEIARQGKLGLADDDPHRPVKAFLIENSSLFGHGAEVLTNAKVASDSVTPHNGMRNTVWRQELDGILLFGASLTANITTNGELVTLSSHFLPNPETAAKLSPQNRRALISAPPVSARRAGAAAANSIGETVDETALTGGPIDPQNPAGGARFTGNTLFGEAGVNFVWLPMDRTSLRLCFAVDLTSRATGERFLVLIDAQTGQALVRQSLTSYDVPSYRVFTSDSPAPASPGLAAPGSNQGSDLSTPGIEYATRALVNESSVRSAAGSPNGWIYSGQNTTIGNNVDARIDRDNSGALTYGDVTKTRPVGSPTLVFDPDPSLSFALEPTTYENSSVVNLFYWCNWMHDRLYELGFVDAHNFEQDNLSIPGRSGGVVARARNEPLANNASFNIGTPWLQPTAPASLTVGVITAQSPGPQREFGLEAQTILHEYTHGLSQRSVGGGLNFLNKATQAMGEGWSDFYSLALLAEPGDDLAGTYPFSAYTAYHFYDGTYDQNYYFGVRRYPYCTNLSKNPLTFKDVDSGQASTHAGVPRNPLFDSVFAGLPADEAHNAGEVWCVTLWEARVALVQKYGFTAGNQLILRIITDAMKLTPDEPNFIQARDAILLADLADNLGADCGDLWSAFAKRGLGSAATAPDSSTLAGVAESFNPVPPLGLSISVVGSSSINESGTQTATFRISTTSDTTSDKPVALALLGTATYGSDYLMEYWDPQESDWFPFDPTHSVAVVAASTYYTDLRITPIPDSRAEGSGETVTLTLLVGANYAPADPPQNSATVTITDDDNANLPTNGWRLFDLGATNGLGINNVGQAAGSTTYYYPATAGFYWDNGYFTYLPPWYYMYPDQNYSFARAINNGGLVVGYWASGTPDNPGGKTPVFWYPEYFDGESVYLTSLPYLPGGQPTLNDGAEDISNAGIIVGQSGTSGGKVHAVAWRPGGYGYYPSTLLTNLGDVGGGSKNSFAAAVNELGEVVGRSEHTNGTSYHAFRATAISGVPKVLTTAGDMGTATGNDAHNSEARDINDLGELVGNSWTTNNQYHAMYKVRQSGKNQGWWDLGVLAQGTADAGDWSRANGINNQGIIVGQSTVQVWLAPWAHVMVQRGFVAANAGNAGSQPLINLTDQSYILSGGTWYTAASQGWAIINAERINDSNWIVGTATVNGTFRAVVLSPR